MEVIFRFSLSKENMAPLRIIMGIITNGITMYMVTAEEKADEITSPIILAQTAVEKRASQ